MNSRLPGTLCIIATMLGATPSARAQVTGPASAPSSMGDTLPLPVFLTISGGISAGSYQSGVNWALLRGLRLAEDSAFRRRHQFGERRLTLGGMTGASAGNINAILTGMEWCRADDERDPRKSLFWRIWVPTGLRQLFGSDDLPAGASPDRGLFDRTYFKQVHLKTLSDYASGRNEPLRDCHVPLGITATKLLPQPMEVVTGIEVPVTRFATSFELVRDGAQRLRNQELRFQDFAVSSQKKHFGPRIWVKSETPTGMSIDDMFRLVTASSAFPVAFAPEMLEYSSDSGCRAKLCGDRREAFVDGGVFDNNPLDLAIGLRRDPVTQGRVYRGGSLLIFIDQDNRRGPARERAPEKETRVGILGLWDLATGFLAAGRAYEMQTLFKLQELDRVAYDFKVRHPLAVTDRRYDIVGTQFGAFAAFLGNPFRQFDFYAGMYDGLHAVARDVWTASRRESWLADPGALAPPDSAKAERLESAVALASTPGAIGRRLHALINDTTVVKYEVDRQVLLELWKREFGYRDVPVDSAPRAVRDSGGGDDDQLVILRALAHASFQLDSAQNVADCSSSTMLGGFFCESDFGRFVGATNSEEALDAAERLDEVQGCDDDNRTDDDKNCWIDDDFVRIRDGGEEELYFLASRLLSRSYANERAIDPTKPMGTIVSIAGLLFNQATLPSRVGWDGDGSTIPEDISALKCIRCWLPYRFSAMAGTTGFEIDYRPTIRTRWPIEFVFPVTPYQSHAPVNDASVVRDWTADTPPPPRAYYAIGAGILWERGLKTLSALELSARRHRAFREANVAFFDDDGARSYYSFTGSMQLLAGRIQAGVRFFPDNLGKANEPRRYRFGGPTTLNDGHAVAIMFSIPDLQGLAYWIAPRD